MRFRFQFCCRGLALLGLAAGAGGMPAQARLLVDIEKAPDIKDGFVGYQLVGPFARMGSSLLLRASVRRGEESLVAWDWNTEAFRLVVPQFESPVVPNRFEAFGVGPSRAVVVVGNGLSAALASTNGTPSGTAILRSLYWSAGYFFPFGSRLLFNDYEPATAQELYITDATVQGTKRISDFNPGPGWSNPFVLGINPRGTLAVVSAFVANDSRALWVTDGTPQGARLLARVDANTQAGIAWLDDNRFVFSANDGVTGREPWISDSTATGTKRLADLRAGAEWSDPERFVAYGSRVLFRAARSSSSLRLFSTDGTSVTDVKELTLDDSLKDAVTFAGKLFFRGYSPLHGVELFVTDGTAAGTALFADLASGLASSRPVSFTVSGGSLYFLASTPSTGEELYVTQGTMQSTRLVREVVSGSGTGRISNLTPLPSGKIAFSADDGVHGRELWSSDGTAAGTKIHDVYDVPNATRDSNASYITSLGSRSVFAAVSTGVASFWATDGTASGTQRIGPPGSLKGLRDVVSIGDRMLFTMDTGSTIELWQCDGTSAGTLILQANFGGRIHEVGHGRALFQSSSALGMTDGTVQGTTTILTTSGMLEAVSLENDHGDVGFVLDHVFHVSGGTAASTRKAFAMGQLQGFSGSVMEIVPFRSGWCFASGWAQSDQLWFTDGTLAGTRLLAKVAASGVIRDLCVQADKLWFAATHPVKGDELWQSDGTAAGTHYAFDAIFGQDGIEPRHLTAIGRDSIYFRAFVPGLGVELGRYDVRSGRMSVAADIHAGIGSSKPANRFYPNYRPFCVMGGKLIFAADDEVHGVEPWVVDHGAVAQRFGRNCGSGVLTSSADPHLGASVALNFDTTVSVPRVHVLCLGAADHGGTSLTRAGCMLHLDSGSFLPFRVRTTAPWSEAVPVPANAALVDAQLAWQVLSFDPVTNNVGSSNATEWTIGR